MNVIILTGISGIEKSGFLDGFIKKAGIRDVSRVVKFEDALTDQARREPGITPPTSVSAFLDQDSLSGKITAMDQTFSWITKNARIGKDVEYVFLDIHLQYYKKTEYFPPLNVSNFQGWIDGIDPDADVKVINLIDDVFDIWQVLKERERDFPNTRLTLREILAWRSLETLQSGSLASSLRGAAGPARSYTVSIKHPFSTFKNLIVPRTPVSVYLSYAISKTRGSGEMVGEINAFRARAHEMGDRHGICVLDPVTIDELILQQTPEGDGYVLDRSGRWPLEQGPLVEGGDSAIRLPAAEVRDSVDYVWHQVRSRDLKLVEQAALLVVFRPYYGGVSTGALAEVRHAKSCGIDMCVYSPAEDAVEGSDNPFGTGLEPVRTEAEFYEALERKLARLAPARRKE